MRLRVALKDATPGLIGLGCAIGTTGSKNLRLLRRATWKAAPDLSSLEVFARRITSAFKGTGRSILTSAHSIGEQDASTIFTKLGGGIRAEGHSASDGKISGCLSLMLAKGRRKTTGFCGQEETSPLALGISNGHLRLGKAIVQRSISENTESVIQSGSRALFSSAPLGSRLKITRGCWLSKEAFAQYANNQKMRAIQAGRPGSLLLTTAIALEKFAGFFAQGATLRLEKWRTA